MNLRSGELRKRGIRVRLPEQPFQVLAALLERPGEIVTREELVRRLWSDGTVVDYEGGLNAAVTRLRQALSDSAETPRYIETVARRGYRWIAPVERGEGTQPGSNPRPPSPPPAPRSFSKHIAVVVAAVTIAVAAVTWWALRQRQRVQQAITIHPLTTGLGMERNASFSPDGTLVVYEWKREDGGQHIYIKVVGTGDPVPLTAGTAAEYGPEWSPDGRLIAFIRANEPEKIDLYVIPPVGGVERKISTLSSPDLVILGRFVRRIAWTADSNHVLVSVPDRPGHGEGLLLVSIADGTQRWLTGPTPDAIKGDREPAVSPDGRRIAFARGEVGASERIWLLPLSADLRPAGDPQPLAASGRARSPAWSPDGQEIVFTGMNPGLADSGLSKVRIGGGAPIRILPSATNAATPTVSRTGRVAFSRIRAESSIWRLEIPSAGRPLLPPVRLTKAAAVDGNADYSPDGRHIVFTSNRSGTRDIWTCDSEGAHCQAITSFGATYATGSPRWSPDGRHIAFDSGVAGRMHIYVVDANGGSPRQLTDDQTGGTVPKWSRDGTWIYFSSARSGSDEIWKIPSAGGIPIRVTRSGGFIVMEAPAGNALYYTKTSEPADLFRSELDGSNERLVLRGITKRGFVIARDRIYYLHQEAKASVSLRVFRVDTGEDAEVAPIVDELFRGLAISPDERYLLYTPMRIESNLILAEGVFP